MTLRYHDIRVDTLSHNSQCALTVPLRYPDNQLDVRERSQQKQQKKKARYHSPSRTRTLRVLLSYLNPEIEEQKSPFLRPPSRYLHPITALAILHAHHSFLHPCSITLRGRTISSASAAAENLHPKSSSPEYFHYHLTVVIIIVMIIQEVIMMMMTIIVILLLLLLLLLLPLLLVLLVLLLS